MPSDVAALAGVDLSVAKRGLVNLANIVGGDLEVSKDGGRTFRVFFVIVFVCRSRFCARACGLGLTLNRSRFPEMAGRGFAPVSFFSPNAGVLVLVLSACARL